LPTNEGLRAQPVDAAHPVFRFEPNRDAVISRNWNFSPRNTVHVNNDGFVNDRDYDARATSPLFAIVGDSYIEASATPYPSTVQGRLAKAVEGRGRVYSFGASGAGLPQYLVWVEYAAQTYHPAGMMVNVVGNDFTESLAEIGASPGFHRFIKKPDGGFEWKRTDYAPDLARRLLRESAVFMYLVTNLNIQNYLNLAMLQRQIGKDETRWVGNIEALDSEEARANYRWAVDVFLDQLPVKAALPPEKIVLSIDGIRPELYDPKTDWASVNQSTFAVMRRYMIEQARAKGFNVIDLHEAFVAAYKRDGKRFEYPDDSHWSAEGHAVVASEVQATPAYQSVFGR